MENKVRPQWPPPAHTSISRLAHGHSTHLNPWWQTLTNSQTREYSSFPHCYEKDKKDAPGATGATGDCPLPKGTPLQRWFQSGQACDSALSLVTLWKWSLTHLEVTITFCGLNSPVSFQMLFGTGTRAAGCNLTDTGPAVRGSTIALSVHQHTQERVCVWICSNQYQSVLYSVASQAKRSRWPPQQTSPCPHATPGAFLVVQLEPRVRLLVSHRVQGHGQEEAPHVSNMGWPEQWHGCPPGQCHRLIQDLPEKKTQVATVPIKNKLCNRWIPISCSSGTPQSHPSLAVAQGRLSHSWKSSLTDTSQQDRPTSLHGERFSYRPALGSVQTERAGRGLLFTFRYYHQWRIGLFWSPFPDLGPDCWAPPGLLPWAQPFSRDAASSQGLAGPARETRRAEGIRAMLPDKGRCHPLAVHLASDSSCWPYCGFHLFNWSPVSTQLFPLTELESTAGQNISTPLWPPSIERFPVPEYGLSESFL